MKNLISSIVCISLFLTSCKQQSTNNTAWAECVESKTVMCKPEGWDDEYWNSVNKNVDRNKIFNTIIDAVLSGKQKAYNILTDKVIPIDEVKEILNNVKVVEAGQPASTKINADDLSMIRMREKWSFDEKEFRMEKHVTRIDLLLKKVDETGAYIGDKALFYVKLKE
jgi:hypothetical protein